MLMTDGDLMCICSRDDIYSLTALAWNVNDNASWKEGLLSQIT